jgi:hypothetical protein
MAGVAYRGAIASFLRFNASFLRLLRLFYRYYVFFAVIASINILGVFMRSASHIPLLRRRKRWRICSKCAIIRHDAITAKVT